MPETQVAESFLGYLDFLCDQGDLNAMDFEVAPTTTSIARFVNATEAAGVYQRLMVIEAPWVKQIMLAGRTFVATL